MPVVIYWQGLYPLWWISGILNNNNNNKGSRGMGEVAPLYGVDPALILTNPGVRAIMQPEAQAIHFLAHKTVHACEWLHPTRGGPVLTEHGRSRGVNPEKKSPSLRCKQPCRRTPEASEVEG